MSHRVLLWVPLAGFLLVLGLVAGGLWRPADRDVHSQLVGQRLPAFALPSMAPGKPGLASTALTGRPRLVNIFASWCIPCAAEAPQLVALRRAGLEVDGIAVRDTPDAVAKFLGQYGDPYSAIADDRESRVQLSLGSSGVPESFLIGPDGRIILQHIGDIRAEEVAGILAQARGRS
jgi:cytochrome c biogenesis protein CcmG, thiol:disulfide interchange protein DsbE